MQPRIAFWGTPDLTVTYLDALHAAGMTPCVIVTNPDRPKGRGHELAAPAPKEWAIRHGIPVLQPEKVDDACMVALEAYDLDVSIVVAYGSILPKRSITIPKHATLNVHYSLLPKYRGAAPTEAAILAGDSETGVSIQVMQPKLDTGPVIAHANAFIGADETTHELRTRLTDMGAALLVWALPDYLEGKLDAVPQDDSQATFSTKIQKEHGLLDNEAPGIENYRKYRAYHEWPRTYFFAQKGDTQIRTIVTKAHMEGDAFVIDRVLPEGKKEMDYQDFLRGLNKQ